MLKGKGNSSNNMLGFSNDHPSKIHCHQVDAYHATPIDPFLVTYVKYSLQTLPTIETSKSSAPVSYFAHHLIL